MPQATTCANTRLTETADAAIGEWSDEQFVGSAPTFTPTSARSLADGRSKFVIRPDGDKISQIVISEG